MKVIYRPRGQGKTTELIKIAAKKFNYIVCLSMDESSRIFNLANSMGLDIPFPITFSEFLDRNYYGKGIKGFCIDNVDMLLQHMSPVPINAVTVNEEEEE